jgi:glycerophosphoryl diester phosphodiesterase
VRIVFCGAVALQLANSYRRVPIVFGHRGASADAPENTLAAFALALRQGADGFELDVTLSADGVPVVIHDDTLDRTTNGAGPVRLQTVAELSRLEAGYPVRFDSRFSGERIPTLAEVFQAFAGRALINVELKRDRSPDRSLAARTVELIQTHRLEHSVLVSSFRISNLRRVKALNQSIPVGLLYLDARVAPLMRLLAGGLRAEAYHPAQKYASPRTVRWCHARRLRVNVWTVDDESDLRRLMAAGVDGLITNHPDRAVSVRAAMA